MTGAGRLLALLRSTAGIASLLIALAAALLAALLATLRFTANPAGIRPASTAAESIDPLRLERHVRALCEEFFPRSFRFPGQLDRAADHLAAEFAAAGGRVSRHPFPAAGRSYLNIVASFGPGSGPRVVVGAHYDSYGELPGADDNASGVAVLLELGRALGATPPEARVDLVAYSLEEPPFFRGPEMGSAAHARALRAEGAEVRGVVVLEMVGYFSPGRFGARALPLALYSRASEFVVVAGRRADRELARRVKGAGSAASAVAFEGFCAPTFGLTDLSDHRSYWQEGFRAVMVTDTAFLRNPHYHTPRDLPETLDYPKMAEVARGVLLAVRELARAERAGDGSPATSLQSAACRTGDRNRGG